MSQHIFSNFDEELNEFRDSVISIGTHTVDALSRAREAFMLADRDALSDIVEDDELIDMLEMRIDEKGMAILMRFKPFAYDLRLVVSSVNISRSFERMADHAVTIAKRSRKAFKKGQSQAVKTLEPLFLEAQQIAEAALRSYADRDEALAQQVLLMDEKADELYKSISKNLMKRLPQADVEAEQLLHLAFIAKSLERIGDLAVNVAEDVIFILSAEDVRHQS